jgi:hypothetical protein
MSIAVIETPNTDVNGHVSKWQAVHEPIEYTLERQDQQVQTKYKPGLSTVRVQVIGSIPVEVAIGQRILWVSGTNSEIFTITGFSGSIIITDGTTVGTVVGGHVVYLDGYNNYFVETKIMVVTPNGYGSLGTMKNKTDLSGQAKINVASYLKTICIYQNNFDYDVLNKAVDYESGKYNLRFREIYNGIEQPLSNPFGAIQYFTNSSKQILEIYGSNMGDYVPTLDATRTDKAKFLSVFDKPTRFKNMPFSLSFIYSDNLLNEEISINQLGYNINGGITIDENEALNHLERQAVNRLMLIDVLTDSTKTIELYLETTGNTIITPPLEKGNVFAVGFASPFGSLNPLPTAL